MGWQDKLKDENNKEAAQGKCRLYGEYKHCECCAERAHGICDGIKGETCEKCRQYGTDTCQKKRERYTVTKARAQRLMHTSSDTAYQAQETTTEIVTDDLYYAYDTYARYIDEEQERRASLPATGACIISLTYDRPDYAPQLHMVHIVRGTKKEG